MNGQLIGADPVVITGYQKIWIDMISMSIRHAQKEDLTELSVRMRLRECYEARCYLLSDQFENDCSWVFIDDEAICHARRCREFKKDNSRCAVCGRKEVKQFYACGRKVCWEHWKIIEAYNKGYNLDEIVKAINKEKNKPPPDKLPLFTGCVKPKLTEIDRSIIKESYANGRKARWLAQRFGVTPRTIHMVVSK